MLRTNSKQAIENIRKYVVDNMCVDSYSPKYDYFTEKEEEVKAGANIDLFSCAKEIIKECVYQEKMKYDKRRNMTRYDYFKEWCQGLPSIFDTCYYYNRSAIDDLAAILEETDEEAEHFSEYQAMEKLTALIYREIYK